MQTAQGIRIFRWAHFPLKSIGARLLTMRCPLGLAPLRSRFFVSCAWHLTVSVGKSAVLPRFTAFRADLRCTSGFMMVILMIWQPSHFATITFLGRPRVLSAGDTQTLVLWFWRVAAGFGGCVLWCLVTTVRQRFQADA